MRANLGALIAMLAFLGCGSSSTPISTSDGGVVDTTPVIDAPVDSLVMGDAGVDSTTSYGADDFSAFQYSWFGTGVSGAFALDRDCGVVSNGQLGGARLPMAVNGVAPAMECTAFKSLVVSPAVLTSLAAKMTMVCSDDRPTAAVTLKDGTVVRSHPEHQCTFDEPYKTLVPKMEELRAAASGDAGDGG